MKRIISLVAGLVVLAWPVVFVSTAIAAVEDPKTTQNAVQKRDQRIASYKTKFTTKLTKTEEAKLKLSCKPAQTKADAISKLATKNTTTRSKAFKSIAAELDTIIPKLNDAKVDTTELVKIQTQLDALIKVYNTDAEAYDAALTDLSALDCQTDPTAFKVALLAARAERSKVVASALAVKSYVKDSVKPELLKAITELKKEQR